VRPEYEIRVKHLKTLPSGEKIDSLKGYFLTDFEKI
jgi:hypothetical protein